MGILRYSRRSCFGRLPYSRLKAFRKFERSLKPEARKASGTLLTRKSASLARVSLFFMRGTATWSPLRRWKNWPPATAPDAFRDSESRNGCVYANLTGRGCEESPSKKRMTLRQKSLGVIHLFSIVIVCFRPQKCLKYRLFRPYMT